MSRYDKFKKLNFVNFKGYLLLTDSPCAVLSLYVCEKALVITALMGILIKIAKQG